MTLRHTAWAFGLLSLSTAGFAANSTSNDLIDTLRNNSGQQLVLQTTPANAYTMLRAAGSKPLLADQTDAPALSRAMTFLAQFGSVVGIADAQNQVTLNRTTTDRAGNQHVHLDQVQNGLPVFGARMVVHMSQAGITGVSGAFIPALADMPRSASQDTTALQAQALRSVQKRNSKAELAVQAARLMYYRSGLLQGYTGENYLAYEVMVRSVDGSIRERVILDAIKGGVINQINEIHSLKNREIYTPNQDVPPVITEGGATAPTDIPLTGDGPSDPASRAPQAPTDNLYIFAGGTYDLYANLFGREGYDDGDLPSEDQVQKSVYLINDACPNAYWNGDSTNYCPGFDADDVVSHEWSHAYTEYTHGLIYQYQSGALNEAYSDIFGEVYDLVNGLEGPLGVSLTEGEYFENGGSRWVMGEDLGEAAAAVLLRDMWDPDNFGINVHQAGIQVLNTGSPGSVITSENYYCEAGDGGGVHTNSAVPNHAFAMLVDGKSFNGVDIPAIGMTRASHIYFHAALHYQIPSTNFIQHADALAQSCADLTGVALNDVLGNPSPDVIDASTCAAVEAAMLSVEMRQSPTEKCDYQPLLQPESATPALCPEGEGPVADFSETWEGLDALPAGWEFTENLAGDTSEGTQWEIVSDLPEPHTGQAAFVANTFGGSCTPGGDISASFRLDSPEIVVSEVDSKFAMNHFVQSEAAFDGGNLKISINGGDFAIVPGTAFSWNPYNITMETGAGAVPDPAGLISGGNTSPLAGEEGWSGSDEGESISTWGVSHVDLSAVGVSAGDSIRFRFEFGQDGCNGNLGWFVDDISVSHCVVGAPSSNGETPSVVTTPSDNTNVTTGASRGGAMGYGLLMLFGLAGLRRRTR
ncbi:MAG: M4 family metallopeptidase [Oceanococcus sp.]